MNVSISEPWHAQAVAISGLLTAELTTVVGIYLHGSAVLGGFGPTSDLDVLVVVRDEPDLDWDSVGSALLRAADGGRALELSVVRSSAAAAPAPPWPFVLHVNSGARRCVLGGDGGDPDLIAHYAVVRAAGLPLYGPGPSAVVGRIERDVLIGTSWGSWSGGATKRISGTRCSTHVVRSRTRITGPCCPRSTAAGGGSSGSGRLRW
ncbi:nucleotidyltransferase domain-containing protein [Occultella gossypii]|uniref:nucleotidyltransferase domain-containing protein n=1 Tax=Occultella gossypii TaxID=2800820 RepID=UPI001CBB3DD3|nr:nucleotidyltransferase domain-containing protein [Occultella gossypii]